MTWVDELLSGIDFALRNIKRQRTRTGLTLAAIALGVAGLILSGGFVEDILLQLREATIRSRLGHLQIYKAGFYASGGHRPFDYLIDDTEAVNRAVDRVPGMRVRASRLEFSGLISNGRGDLPVIGEGVEAEAEARLGTAVTMIDGRRLAPADAFAAVIGEGLARAMKLSVDDVVNLVVSTRDGAVNTLEFRVVGVSRSMSKEYDARAVQIPLAAAMELVDTQGVNAIVVLLDNTDDAADAGRSLKASLPSADFEIKSWEELADFYTSTAALYERQLGVLQIIILVMVLLSVANTVNMTLHERTSEFGVMRALGRKGSDVFRLAVAETAILGVVGAAIGVIVGMAIAILVSAVGISMPPPPNSEAGFRAAIRIVPTVVAFAFLLGVGGATIASLFPARRVARMPVVEALRRAK